MVSGMSPGGLLSMGTGGSIGAGLSLAQAEPGEGDAAEFVGPAELGGFDEEAVVVVGDVVHATMAAPAINARTSRLSGLGFRSMPTAHSLCGSQFDEDIGVSPGGAQGKPGDAQSPHLPVPHRPLGRAASPSEPSRLPHSARAAVRIDHEPVGGPHPPTGPAGHRLRAVRPDPSNWAWSSPSLAMPSLQRVGAALARLESG